MKLFSFPSVAILALTLVVSVGSGRAQQPGTDAWKQLQQHPNTWPAQLTLKADVQFDIMHNGQKVGSFPSPAGSNVQLIAVDDAGLRVGVGSSIAVVLPDQTDFAQRMAAMKPVATSAALTNAAAAPAPTTPADPNAALKFDFEGKPSHGYDTAQFRFWSPASKKPLSGLLVLMGGTGEDGRDLAADPDWQAFARRYQLGIVGSNLSGIAAGFPKNGSGDAFHAALRSFAKQSGHPEIPGLPLLLWSGNNGGLWVYNYLLWRPAAVLGFVANGGDYFDGSSAPAGALATPGLFIVSKSDSAQHVNAFTNIWSGGRTQGALWALAPESTDDNSRTSALSRAYFDSILKARLDNAGSADAPAPVDLSIDPSADASDMPTPSLKSLQENAGWLGNPTSHDVHDDSSDSDIDRTASWLPDQASAQAWKGFVSGG